MIECRKRAKRWRTDPSPVSAERCIDHRRKNHRFWRRGTLLFCTSRFLHPPLPILMMTMGNPTWWSQSRGNLSCNYRSTICCLYIRSDNPRSFKNPKFYLIFLLLGCWGGVEIGRKSCNGGGIGSTITLFIVIIIS